MHAMIDSAKFFRRCYPWIVVLAVMGILAARRPDVITNPQPTWEDGRVFLSEAVAAPWWHTAFKPFIGYFIVIPRMIACVFTPSTIHVAPLVFNVSALMVSAFALSLPVFPAWRHVMPLPLRTAWVLCAALMPWQTETLGNLSCIHLGFR